MKLIRFLISRTFLINLAIAIILFILFIWGSLFALAKYTHHGEAFSVPDFYGLTVSEADSIALSSKLKCKIIDTVFLAKLPKGKIIEQIPKPDFRVKEGRTVFLTYNSKSAKKIKMPNLLGVSLRQAQAIAETYGLVIGEQKYVPAISTTVKKQLIDNKEIENGSIVDEGSVIDLIIGLGNNNMKALIPNIKGLNIEDAKRITTEFNLNLGMPIYDTLTIKTIDDSLNAKIFKQKPDITKNKEIPLGTIINVWLTIDSTLIPQVDTLFMLQDSIIENDSLMIEEINEEK